MHRLISTISTIFMLLSCSNSPKSPIEQRTDNVSIVNVYYFHGKQRCKTCIAVGNLSKETIDKNYAGNTNVKFIEVDTSEKTAQTLVEKYEVSWNALIIAKGENIIDITEQAFASAIDDPTSLQNLIKQEVDSRLK